MHYHFPPLHHDVKNVISTVVLISNFRNDFTFSKILFPPKLYQNFPLWAARKEMFPPQKMLVI